MRRMGAHRVKSKKRQSGQVLMEFIFAMLIILTLVFYFLQLAWSLAWGHYVQYSTFMAGRAYFAATVNPQDQLDNASSVLGKMIKSKRGDDLLGFVAKSRSGGERDVDGDEPIEGAFIGTHPTAVGGQTSRAYSWAHGVQYNYKVKMFILPLAGMFSFEDSDESIRLGDDDGGETLNWDGNIPMTSDAWLGREPTVTECDQFMNQLSNGTGINRRDGRIFIYDNGC